MTEAGPMLDWGIRDDRACMTKEDEEFIKRMVDMMLKARRLHPSPNINKLALDEEVGEVSKAVLEEPWENVYDEAVQAAAMCLRLAVEGDPIALSDWRAKHRFYDMPGQLVLDPATLPKPNGGTISVYPAVTKEQALLADRESTTGPLERREDWRDRLNKLIDGDISCW
jgi:hypothetical protein